MAEVFERNYLWVVRRATPADVRARRSPRAKKDLRKGVGSFPAF